MKIKGQTKCQRPVNMTNTVLEACQMEPLDRHYRLDSILLSSFQEEEMLSISDMIEGKP